MEKFTRGKLMVSMVKKRSASPPKEKADPNEYVRKWIIKHQKWFDNHEVEEEDGGQQNGDEIFISDINRLEKKEISDR